jgi:hypothetical protein
VRYLLTIKEPSFEVTGTYVATRDGSMRIDIEADGQRVFSEGVHDGQAWQWTAGEGIALQDLHQSGENVNLDSGEWLATTRVRSIEHNIEIPEGYFQAE